MLWLDILALICLLAMLVALIAIFSVPHRRDPRC